MSTEFFNDQWRIPSNENQNKVSNYSMDFSGVSAGVNAGPLSDILGNGPITHNTSYSVWIKPEFDYTTPFYQTFFGNYTSGASGVLLYYHMSSDRWTFIVGDGTGNSVIQGSVITSNQELGKGEWQHHCVVIDNVSNNAYYYIDGTQINTSTSLGRNINTNANFYIGKKWDLTSGKFEGEITQGCIFDYALSTSQRDTLYGGGTAVGNPMSLSPKPVAYYQLGEQSAYNGANYLVPNNSLSDYVFNFDGSNDYIDLGTPSILGNSNIITLSAWFNPSITVNNYGPFIGIREAGNTFPYQLGVSNTTKVRFIISESVGTFKFILGNDVLSINNWYHAVAVANGTDLRLYINGVLQNDIKTYNGTLVTPTSNILMGKQGAVSTAIFNGEMSNLALWNTDLTGPQVTTLYNNGTPIQTLANIPQSSNLKAWYKLDTSETYNSTTTDWEVNQAQAPYQNSVFCPNVSGQTVTDYLQVPSYPGLNGLSEVSFSFWYNTTQASNQGGWLSGGVAEFKRNAGGQRPGMEFTLYTEVGGVNQTYSTYMPMPYGRWYLLDNGPSQTLNKWINVVLTYDANSAPQFGTQSGSLIAYVNGVKQNTAAGTSGGVTNPGYNEFPAEGTVRTNNLIFGGGDFASRHVSASLSNYATWNKALTQSEITEIVNNGQPKDLSTHSASSNLVSWWKLNNLTTGLVDTIGGYNASIVGSNSYNNAGSVSQLNGTSVGMSQANLVQSNLQHTSGYSPYALDFDGTNQAIDLSSDIALTGNRSVNFWFTWRTAGVYLGGSSNNDYYPYILNATSVYLKSSSSPATSIVIPALQTGKFYNMCITGDGTTVSVYINGSLAGTGTDIANITLNTIANVTSNAVGADGNMSNTAIWTNTVLSPSEVIEIYNQGVPSNLNNFSGTAPTHWWQLGSNSSFNTNWTCLDEIGTNNGVSVNMTNDDIVNGPGYSANGLGTSTIDIVGDAPYSTANGLSENMDVLDRVTDVPS